MCYLLDCLYDFSVSITNEVHDFGTIGNRKMFVEDFCEHRKIVRKDRIKAIKKYSKYYIKNNISWFPLREEVEEWYSNYKNK